MRRYGRGVDAATIVGLLADPARLKVVAALALGAGTLEEVAQLSGLPLKDVALAARRLGRAGLVRRDRHVLGLHDHLFAAAARAAAESRDVRALHVEVGPDNPVARRLYERAGYAESGHLFLTLPLAAPVHDA